MSDVEKEIDELQCKLTAKTREIEALVAEELNLGDINAMEGTTYARLQTYVEEMNDAINPKVAAEKARDTHRGVERGLGSA